MSSNNDLDANNNENQDDFVFGNSIEDLSKSSANTEEDMPDVDVTTTRKSSSAKKLKMMALGVLAMLIALVATGITFNRATEARQAKKALEAEQAVANQKNLNTNSSRIDIGDDQAELEALNGLPTPADAMAEPIMLDSMAQPIAPMPTPTAMPDSTPAPVMMPEPTSPPMASPMQSLQNMGMFDDAPAPQIEYAPPPPTPAELKRQRLLSGNVMAYETAGRTAVTANGAANGAADGANGAYKATALSNGSASKRGDTSMILMKGTSIPCVLRTKIVSDYKGFTTCQVSKNVYSANGKVLLIERGSKVFGEQNIEIKQGQSSVFVLWTRVETPKGISVNLESPAVGQLGEMGVKADVKSHFWKRFGGAIMLSLIQDTISAGTSRLESTDNGENNTTVQATSRTTESMAEKALDSTINIPPTATVPQGTLMNILVVRDVDFGGVYGLRK